MKQAQGDGCAINLSDDACALGNVENLRPLPVVCLRAREDGCAFEPLAAVYGIAGLRECAESDFLEDSLLGRLVVLLRSENGKVAHVLGEGVAVARLNGGHTVFFDLHIWL